MKKAQLALATVAVLILAALATVFIGDNVGTAEQRCHRFWKPQDQQFECERAYYKALSDEAGEDLARTRRSMGI